MKFTLDQWNNYYKNYIEMYSIHNQGKTVVIERLTAVSKTVYSHKLDDIAKKYNKTIYIIQQLKWSLLTLKTVRILTLVKNVMIKILNFKFSSRW